MPKTGPPRKRNPAIAATLGVILTMVFATTRTHAADFGGYRPHYQGYGVNTPGGRGGVVLRVTNLNDSGPGSLRAALEASGPRFVIFETSGTIVLTYPIFITSGRLTIAGQTAPSPGITIRDWPIVINAPDVVVQHIRIRIGDTAQTPGHFAAIQGGGSGGVMTDAPNSVIDHVSVAWTMYQGHVFYSPDVAILDSIFAYGLVKSNIYTGMGGAIGARHTFARNLYVHNSHRQPIMGPGSLANVVNNVIYGSGPGSAAEDYTFSMMWQNSCGQGWGDDTDPRYRMQIVYANNYIIPSYGTGSAATAGSDSTNKAIFMSFNVNNLTYQDNRIWLAGNKGPGITGPSGAGQWAGVLASSICEGVGNLQSKVAYASEPSWHSAMNFSVIPTDGVPDHVFGNAGARPTDRDSVDRAAVAHAQAGMRGDTSNMGRRISSQDEMGGHPNLARNVRALQVPANPNAVAPGQTFRTNIEMWLEDYARQVEGAAAAAAPSSPRPPQNLRIVS